MFCLDIKITKYLNFIQIVLLLKMSKCVILQHLTLLFIFSKVTSQVYPGLFYFNKTSNNLIS